MYRVRFLISYLGTDYFGWQKQPKHKPTVQETLEKVLSKICDQKVRVIGSGRTDRGTHAIGQRAHADLPKDPSSFPLQHAMNSMLPSTIRIQEVQICPEDFHAQRSALQKKYIYKIDNSPAGNPLLCGLALHVPKTIDLQALNQLCEPLLGEHDYASFQSKGTEVESTVRRNDRACWSQKGSILTFHIVGNGFLKQMVRNIVGTQLRLLQKGQGPEELVKILQAKKRQAAYSPAEAHGLYLKWVKYPPELDNKCRKL